MIEVKSGDLTTVESEKGVDASYAVLFVPGARADYRHSLAVFKSLMTSSACAGCGNHQKRTKNGLV